MRIVRGPFVVTLPSPLCRLCAMCDLGACSPGAAAGHPATHNIPTTAVTDGKPTIYLYVPACSGVCWLAICFFVCYGPR